MLAPKFFVPASEVRVGDVLCFGNPKSQVKVQSISHREMDGRIGFHANDDTWVSFYIPAERVRIQSTRI